MPHSIRRKWTGRNRLCALLIAAIVMTVAVLSPPYVDVIDAKVRVEVTHSIVDRGSLAIAEIPGYGYLSMLGADGRHYSVYGLGQSLVLIPLDVLAKLAAAAAPVGANSKLVLRDSLLGYAYTLVMGGLLAWVMFLALRTLRLSHRSSARGVALLFFATCWLIWGRSMQEETLAAAMLLGAYVLAHRALAGRGGLASIAGAGLLLGLLANVRYNAIFAAAALGLWTCWRLWQSGQGRRVAALVLSGLPGIILAAAYNRLRFGSWTDTGYATSMAYINGGQTPPWDFGIGRLVDFIVGLDCGLLWFTLPLLFLPWAFKNRARALTALLLLALAGNTVFMAAAPGLGLGGGSGYCGPRYLAHGVLVLAPFIWLGVRRASFKRPRWAKFAVPMLFAASIVMQAAAIPLSYHLESVQDDFAKAGGGVHDPKRWIPRRYANLLRLATGSLYDASLPASAAARAELSSNALYGARIFTTPELTPWRLKASTAAESLPGSVVTAVIVLWGALAAGSGLVWWRFARRLRRRKR